MWNNLKASIAAVVRTNNNQEITGANLQNVLNTIVNSVGANATFAGIATPSTNPGTPDGPVFYIAYEPGVYSNFNITTVDGLYILENKTGSWVGTRISTIGTPGTTFTPHVNSDGDISWTNDGGKPNPETVNIKGPQGDTVILGDGETYKLYNSTGQNTDGAMTQKAVTDKIAEIAEGQHDLTLDDTPTAGSNNPVKSNGIKVALDTKQDTINTVNVEVDNNTGTPSGSASISGSTLLLSFQNLKGAPGAAGTPGATGLQGPRGERGLPGESGVTGDVSGFTVRQAIDPSATYGPTDIAGAATVQATNEELTEVAERLGKHHYKAFDVAAGSSTPTTQGLTVNISLGTRFYVKVDDSLGDGNLYTLLFRYDGQSTRTEIQRILSGTKYEFVATQDIADICVWKAAVDTNKTVSINAWTSVVGDTEFLLGKFEDISSQQNELLLEGSADFLQICTKRTDRYVAITNGSINTYTGLDLYSAKIPSGVKSFRIYSAGKDSNSAAIAFYSSETQNTSTFISTGSVANTAQAQMMEVDIPNGAVSVAFTNYPTTVATPVIRAVGVDYVKAEDFGNSVKVITQDIFSETYPHVNALPIANYVSAKWIRKTDGVPVQTSSYLGYYKITIEDWMKKVFVKSYVSDSNPAAIAFYSSDTPSSDTYLSTSSVPSIAGTNYYYSDIPANAVCFCITHRNDGGDALPIIEVTGQGGVSKGYIDQIVGSKLIASRNAAGVTGSSIIETINLSQYEDGTHFLLKAIDTSGTKNKLLGYITNNNSRTFYLTQIETGGYYYFDKTSEFTSIRLYCASGTNEVMDFELYVVSNSPYNNNTLMQPDTISLEQNSINLGEPLQGKYWITPTTTYNAGEWVCFQIQYSKGYSIHLNIDFETYYLALKLWYSDLSTIDEARITAETDYYLPLRIGAWHIQVRRIDRVPVDAETVIDALTCTFVSGSGLKWEKPAPISFVESHLSEVQEKINSISTQTGNPFVNKPWYAHYSPDGFIKDRNGNNVIASESLADIEMAARLGFSFIEANIQQTSDGNFIVTHGNSGAFGNEVKSTDESVITTADLQATAINSKTLDWIKTYVRYNSTLEKYQTTIPTLEEFCKCCKENNIGIFGGTNQRTAIDIMIKYLGKDAIIVYNPPSDIRDYFNGLIFTWNNSSGTTPETLLANAKNYGAPYMCGIGPTLYAELVSNGLEDFIEDMHKNGFLVGHAYLSEADAREAFRMGMDFAAASHDVNPFKGDKVYDLDGNASDFTTTGTVANNVATLSSGQTISCGASDVLPLAKCSLSIRFTGSLRISFGSYGDWNRTITSDGTDLIVITDYCYKRSPALMITATTSTTITGLVYKCAIC